MENNKQIKIGNWTVAKSEFEKITIEDAKQKFYYMDSRIVEKAFLTVNPKGQKSKRKAKKKTD